MIVVIVIVVVAWLLASKTGWEQIIQLLSVGLVASFIVAVMASLSPIIEIPINGDEALRVYSPAAYPFCIQQYRNYDANLFNYTVSFGWPEGTPLLQFALQEDQSHFIHAQHYLSGLSLGLLLLLVVVALIGLLTLIERKSIVPRKQGRSSVFLLIALQFILILQIFSQYFSGNIIYPLGGTFILLVTLYPTYRAFRGSGLLKASLN